MFTMCGDRMYLASPLAPPVPLHVDLREWGGPIKDQGEEGSCTGHAFSSAREWIARKYETASQILSPQCLYVEELIADGSFPKDEGAMPRTGCQVLTAKGCCEASLYPYIAGKLTAPTTEQAQNAFKYKTGADHRIGSLPDFLRCLADPTPWPVPVGFAVRESFMSQQVADTGVMPIPKPGEKQQGGHEVLCLGYDFPKQLALMQNSWATVGDSGDISGCHLM
jgi:C1A family cysteine protease